MNETRLIVNADDFGRSPGVNRGILKAHQEGIVSTATAMMNLKGSREAVLAAQRRCPTLGMGVHLNITHGSPLNSPQDVSSLLKTGGQFHDFRDLMAEPEMLLLEEVELEWRYQIEVFLEAGGSLDHLDSHHHSAVFSPELFELLLTLASEYGCGVRNPCPADLQETELRELYSEQVIRFVCGEAQERLDRVNIPHPDALLASFFAELATVAHLERLLTGLETGIYELMCHPGWVDDEVAVSSSYAEFREQELSALTEPNMRSLLESRRIKLHTFQSAWMN